MTHPSPKRNMVPKAVLIKSGLVSFNTARQVNTAHTKATVNGASPMPKAVDNAARPKAVINAVNGNNVNAIKASAYYEEIDGGYVAFGGNPKGRKIICRVPRKNNMYSIDLKNIVPKGDLTCLFVKATSDEFKLWHRRLGHINFKTMNKLVKGNLVRGLPSKLFGKQSSCVLVKKVGSNIELLVFSMLQFSITIDHIRQVDGMANEGFFVGIEAIRLFLAYASFKDFLVYQMDVKSTFLYGKIEDEVYVYQPPGFEDPDFPDRVYKVEKALYGLHQASRACYETMSTYLLDNGFQRGKIDKTLFIRRDKGDILLVQVYVDDIIFGSTKRSLCTEFEKMMHKKFQKSSMGELTFFLGLQVKQKEDGIFISQDKYVTKILKKFGFTDVKTASTPMETQKLLLKDEDGEEVDVHMYRSMIGSLMYLTSSRPDIMFAVCACARYQVNPKVSHLHAVKRIFRYLKGQPKLGLWYPKDSPFDLVAYTDSDYAGASLDRKSTTGGCQFLRSRLISWQCKKQTVVANSTTEAEYVAASSCCGQVLWIQNQLLDYGIPRSPQPSGPTDNVADEAVYEEMDDSLERAATTATSLDAEQDRGNINKTQSKATLNEPSSLGTSSGSGPRRQETMGDTIAQTGFENVSKTSNDSLLAGVNTPQSDEDRINLVSTHFDADTNMFGVHDLVGDEVVVETEVASKDVNLSVDEVTLAQALVALKSAKPKADKVMLQEPEQGTIITTTAATTVTAASTRPKAKGLVIHEQEQAPTPTVSSQQPSQLKVWDKGKGIMVEEPEKPMKKKELIRLDEEIASKLQAEFDEEVRLAREKAENEEEANIVSWDNVQEMIDGMGSYLIPLMLLVQKLLLLVLKVNVAGMKVTTAKRLQLLEDFGLTEKRSKTYQKKNKD
ncbi:putative ribonuclease H-like domain-containing protein [Tanacetum coccineum]|uniref:Ribonuclease H-like domain-containing protein n=1 Tax=Tanacetum coccineum TaxID=301880 RepID=A0ABQ5HTL1_9ASTR